MIKFVYFDVGCVLIKDFDTDPNKWIRMKKVMGVKPSFEKQFDEMYTQIENKSLCISQPVDTIIPLFEKKFKMKFPPGFSLQQYYLDHFEPNPDIVPVVTEISKTSQIGLLTNQYPGMLKETIARGLLPDFNWDVVVDSSIVKLQKPDIRVFEYAQKAAKVNPPEILFIDNRQKNLNPAQQLGWQVYLYDPSDFNKSSKELLKYYLKLV